MNFSNQTRRPSKALMILLLCGGSVAFAATAATKPNYRAQYQRAAAVCLNSQYAGDRDECMSEATAAFDATQPTPIETDPGRYARNALKRCEVLKGDDQKDCVARMQGQGTAQGSVAGGGIYRELVTIETPPPVVMPAAVPMEPAAAVAPAMPVPVPAPVPKPQ